MKLKILILSLFAISFAFTSKAQMAFFKPKPSPYQFSKTEFLGANAATAPLVKNFVRPIVNVTATTSNGEQLAAGFGISFQHDKADSASNSWVVQYSISAIGFIGTNGQRITGLVGLAIGIPGTGGLIQIGPAYDVTQGQWCLLTGVGFSF